MHYLQCKTDIKLEKEKELALKKVNAGESYFEKRKWGFPCKYLFWHLYNMLVCYWRVLKNFKKAKHYAEWIIGILKNNPSKVPHFCKLAGICLNVQLKTPLDEMHLDF